MAPACERARSWAALNPDGELSSIEGRLLDAHLAHCPACHVFAEDVAAATEALRSAAVEQPRLAFDVAAARRIRRRHGFGRLARTSAAAAALIVAFGVGVIAPDPRPGAGASPQAPVIRFGAGVADEGELVRAERTAGQRAWLVDTGRPYGVLPT